MLLFYFVLQML